MTGNALSGFRSKIRWHSHCLCSGLGVKMAIAVSVLRVVFFVSGAVFAFVVLARQFGLTISSDLAYYLVGGTLSVCMLTLPTLFTLFMPTQKDADNPE